MALTPKDPPGKVFVPDRRPASTVTPPPGAVVNPPPLTAPAQPGPNPPNVARTGTLLGQASSMAAVNPNTGQGGAPASPSAAVNTNTSKPAEYVPPPDSLTERGQGGSFPKAQPDNAFIPKPNPNVKTVLADEQYLENCPRGTLVRLLVPIFDGVKRIEADTEIYWPHDEPPLKRTACHAGDRQTPLDAPAMTSGVPSPDYIDPETGQKPVIEST